jgi:hypothetical protein
MTSVASSTKQNSTFEFTKRKRWADLLVSELADAILLVLSSSCNVLFCGSAVTELLGWRDDEVVDGDLMDLMNVEDQNTFRLCYEESIRTNTELLNYTRLKCKNHFQASMDYQTSPREILFELKGYPHYIAEDDGRMTFKCFFAAAKPYPGRNTAVLNTFLELKMENERLQQRVIELKAHNITPKSSSHYAPSLPSAARSAFSSQRTPDLSSSFYPLGASHSRSTYDILPSPSRSGFDVNTGYGSSYASSALVTSPVEEDVEDTTKRKKAKKVHSSEQYVCVTCGRTDSPEWRKGPLGPKTLCNACGLRWAKQMRKFDDTNEGGGENAAAAAPAG